MMPDWARARTDRPTDPQLRAWITDLRQRLFGKIVG